MQGYAAKLIVWLSPEEIVYTSLLLKQDTVSSRRLSEYIEEASSRRSLQEPVLEATGAVLQLAAA